MNFSLDRFQGRWYINLSNFPMWLKGDKHSPSLNYAIETKNGIKGLSDQVIYYKKAKKKSILGFDRPLNDCNTSFEWQGKGFLFLLKSKWSILHYHPTEEWAIIAFEKTLFTPQGYDVISRKKKLNSKQLEQVNEQLKILGISSTLTFIPQEIFPQIAKKSMSKLRKIDWNRDCRINDHPNTFGYALEILYDKGYQIYIIPSEDEHHFGEYLAYKDNRDFWAEDPLKLLSLVTIWEHYGDEWYETGTRKESKERREFMEDYAFPDDAYRSYSDDEFMAVVQHLQGYFYVLGFELSHDVSRQELYDIMSKE